MHSNPSGVDKKIMAATLQVAELVSILNRDPEHPTYAKEEYKEDTYINESDL